MDRTLCTNLTLKFLIPQNTEMGFQKILLLCRYDEKQMRPADNFLFMINQYGVKCEARETPHCILTTTAIAKQAKVPCRILPYSTSPTILHSQVHSTDTPKTGETSVITEQTV
jgi:hypothetical protein